MYADAESFAWMASGNYPEKEVMGQHKVPKPQKPHFDVRAPRQKFSIAFQTTLTGILQSVDVTLEVGTLADDETANIAMPEHPLYEDLWRYCKANPPRSQR